MNIKGSSDYFSYARSAVGAALLAACLTTGVAHADDYLPTSFGNFLYGGSLYNTMNTTADGFAFYINTWGPSTVHDIVTGNAPSYYPEGVAESALDSDIADGTKILWFGSTTAPNALGSFFVEFDNAFKLTGSAFWQREFMGDYIPIGPSYTIAGPDWSLIELDYQGYVSVALDLAPNEAVFVQRMVNVTRTDVQLKSLPGNDGVWDSGTLLDPEPIRVPKGHTVVHHERIDAGVGNVLIKYEVFSSRRGRAGDHLGTFYGAVEIQRDGQ